VRSQFKIFNYFSFNLAFSLVFSQSLYLLDLIEFFLDKVSDASDEEREEFYCGLPGSYISGINYFRIDGKTSVQNRFQFIKKFNNPSNMK
jgi:transcriptional regulator ATRX